MKIYNFVEESIRKHYTLFCVLYAMLRVINFLFPLIPDYENLGVLLEILEYLLNVLLGF